MFKTGIRRQVDGLGRIVLPVELRRTFGLAANDALEILVAGDTVVLRKYQPGCIFCGSVEGLERFYGKEVCDGCRAVMPPTAPETQQDSPNRAGLSSLSPPRILPA